MNNIYIYKNDFLSLLNLIDLLIKNNITPNNIKNEFYNPSLFDNIINLDININHNIVNNIIQESKINACSDDAG